MRIIVWSILVIVVIYLRVVSVGMFLISRVVVGSLIRGMMVGVILIWCRIVVRVLRVMSVVVLIILIGWVWVVLIGVLIMVV